MFAAVRVFAIRALQIWLGFPGNVITCKPVALVTPSPGWFSPFPVLSTQTYLKKRRKANKKMGQHFLYLSGHLTHLDILSITTWLKKHYDLHSDIFVTVDLQSPQVVCQIQHSFNARLRTNTQIFLIIIEKKGRKNRSMKPTCNPLDFACCNVIDLPRDIRISPGDVIERKQQENNKSSHHELISKQIWSSICWEFFFFVEKLRLF